jgi:sugar O-acyltransferase (sialic acid O-acetyltransferase NeuD family)
MKKLIIIGARGFGREVHEIAPSCKGYGTNFVLKGFLDSDSHALDPFSGYAPILAAPEVYAPCPDDVFFCAMGDVKWRQHYVQMMMAKGVEFQTLIHVGADIGRRVTIGDGCLIRNHVTLTTDIRIGNHICFFDCANVGHDVVIGDYCHLGAQTFLGGGVHLGCLVMVHPGARIVPHKTIGDGATIGIGSVVLRNVKAGQTVFGVPALPIDF